MKRILFVANVDWFFLSHRLPLALAAQAEGYDVHVAATRSEAAKTIEKHGIQFHSIHAHRGSLSPLKDLSLLLSLYRLYRRIRPDIVHHITSKPVIVGSIAARAARVDGVVNAIPGLGLVFSASGFLAKFRRILVVLSYRIALPRRRSKVIFQNIENRDLFLKWNLVAPDSVVFIRGSGVDLSEYIATDEPDSTPVVVMASRMLRQKGVPEFVDAACEIKRRGIKAKFVLVGAVDSENPDHIAVADLENWTSMQWIEWYGHRTDMPEIFQGAHIVCLPTSYGEGVPKVLIEAAACGRPIVTTDVPGCNDIVRNGWNGLLVPKKNREALVAALLELLADREKRSMMGRNGRELVEREFDVELVVAATMTVYEELRQNQANKFKNLRAND